MLTQRFSTLDLEVHFPAEFSSKVCRIARKLQAVEVDQGWS